MSRRPRPPATTRRGRHLCDGFAFGLLLLVALTTRGAAADPDALRLWYAQPAVKWEEALPVGSGRLGAMVFGRTATERIQFNEDTLWTGKPHDYVRAGSAEALPEVRRLLLEGRIKEAETLGRSRLLSDPVRQKAYQPFGDLWLEFPGHETVTDYRRELDLDRAVATTTYRVGGVTFRREVLASHPGRALLVHLTASEPGVLTTRIRLDAPHRDHQTTAASPDQLHLEGRVQADGLRFAAHLQVRPTGGTLRPDGTTLVVEGADSILLLLVAETSFRSYTAIDGDPVQRCREALLRLQGREYATLRDEHTADHQQLFRRAALRLEASVPTAAAAALATDVRLRQVRSAGKVDGDPGLVALHFAYGRYLLIASSRPGSQPANLQGVWNELLNPPWESKWTTNINAEMNYWPAEVTNLSECHEPLFSLIEDLTVSGARTARSLYRSRGWVVHHNTDLWRGTAPINNIDGLWPTGGAWLGHHLWEHYRFTGDRAFLRDRAYPALRDASRFFIDSLVTEPTHGWLVTSPSFSPEQGTLCLGPTMDIQLIRWLWQATREAAATLGTDPDLVTELATLLPKLPPPLIGRHGQLQEWLEDVDQPNNQHRHLSPLWALFPGSDIVPTEPKVWAAAKRLLTWRGEGSTGWSFAWRIPLWARVGDGDFAYRQLSQLLVKRTLPNLFDLCGPFQIDGNFGATAGVAEMLLQSHQQTPDASRSVVIDLLPALPRAWPSGQAFGLCARDGFVVDQTWSEGRLTRVTLTSRLGRTAVLRYGTQQRTVVTTPGSQTVLDGSLAPMTE
ncbi:MAG: glycoside hydrolase family 95 protein [Opitutaceae bacterium]|nr:glycoside hydrolase family 95 protein [Opitutaceae bacterium]